MQELLSHIPVPAVGKINEQPHVDPRRRCNVKMLKLRHYVAYQRILEVFFMFSSIK